MEFKLSERHNIMEYLIIFVIHHKTCIFRVYSLKIQKYNALYTYQLTKTMQNKKYIIIINIRLVSFN